ncbi:hypothetical protein ACOI1C_22155, partial [Bacillus sp. DJP31]|uniref:hypothetical protein n=1 Tax=Bacillus sp. DJP31 TaxID=3409789 RepID=UPI003BB4C25A
MMLTRNKYKETLNFIIRQIPGGDSTQNYLSINIFLVLSFLGLGTLRLLHATTTLHLVKGSSGTVPLLPLTSTKNSLWNNTVKQEKTSSDWRLKINGKFRKEAREPSPCFRTKRTFSGPEAA